MLNKITQIFTGDPVRRVIEQYSEQVEQINALEPTMRELSDTQLRAKTQEFKQRLKSGETLEDLLVEAYAVVREVSIRTIGLRHFDVQLIGGIVLHEGQIAEMKTGEGKTLVATMPLYLNALTERGAHLVTVNDYLARRDARWMGPIYDFLGMSVGVLQEASRTEHGRKAFLYNPGRESSQEDIHQLDLVDRREAYQADITYGTNNEFGFDYLRDNMAKSLEARSQREHHYAILDEVDNILIDEARTPLIISGPSHEDPEMYHEMTRVVKQLSPEDYEISERDRTVSLTEIGENHVERLLGRPLRDPDRPEDITPEQARLLGYLEQALRSQFLFHRNKDYVVQGGRVIIVDEFTGRMMPGRRWSDGLHQAVEAKEGVKVRQENVTYATITLQNYFRMYEKLAGMTGTAATEAEEFNKIYDVDVTVLPMNLEYVALMPDTDLLEVDYRENGNKFTYYARPEDEEQEPVFWKRKDYPDVVYRTEEAKLRAVTAEILRRHVIGQPLLVGTSSVELSEKISGRLGSNLLQKLMAIDILRDAYMEAHAIPDDGRRVEELQQLYGPLEELNKALIRPFSRELKVSLNPLQEDNLARLLRILDLEAVHEDRLVSALKGGIPNNVLNAKKHTEESQIIASAGEFGAVTIATNMAGRGVDIKLGGEIAEEVLANVNRVLRRTAHDDPEAMNMVEREEALKGVGEEAIGIYQSEVNLYQRFMEDGRQVREVGGLHVLGSERHDARRIDNQLRGRAARQGDPGSSQFFLSLEDELMRLFGGAQVSNMMQRLNIDDAIPLAHGIVNRTIEQSQSRVEGANFDRRKHLLEYDDVLNQQREIFYNQRNRVFVKGDLTEDINQMLRVEIEEHVEAALMDEEGPWRLLAWLEETQPTLRIESDRPYPSFMLELLLEELEGAQDQKALKEALMEIASRSMEAQNEHLHRAVQEQLDRSLERLEDQIEQRLNMAETAIEGALIDAEDQETPVNPKDLIRATESAIGMNIQISEEVLERIREDPFTFRDSLPGLIETSLGLRVWTGLVAAVEGRMEAELGIEKEVQVPIDWDQSEELLFEAMERVWSEKRDQLLQDISRDLDQALNRAEDITDDLKIRLLVQMSYGQQTYFDKKTHQRRSVLVARLSYAFYVAELIERVEAETLVERVWDHLQDARRALQRLLGRYEFAQQGAKSLEALEDRLLQELQVNLGKEALEEHREAGMLSALPEKVQEQIIEVMGQLALTESYRALFLSVADRLWVEYLTQMEALRTSIGLEAYGQRDPLVQYKSRAVDLFRNLLALIRNGVVSRMFLLQPRGIQQGAAVPTRNTGGDGRSPVARGRTQRGR